MLIYTIKKNTDACSTCLVADTCVDQENNCQFLNNTFGFCDDVQKATQHCQHFCGLCPPPGLYKFMLMRVYVFIIL